MTMDVDLSLLTGFSEEEVFVDDLLHRAIILPGVTIGEGAVIGSGSVVAKDVEPFSITVGNPARKIGERPRELVYECDYWPWML